MYFYPLAMFKLCLLYWNASHASRIRDVSHNRENLQDIGLCPTHQGGVS